MDKITNFKDLKKFFKGKRILITGHTGFKGSWLTQTLLEFGSIISGISLDPYENSLFDSLELSKFINDNRTNILDLKKCDEIFSFFKPEIIFHLAAQPLVKLSYSQPIETHMTNYIGTANILSLLSKHNLIKAGVFITTDKVYRNDEKGLPFKEDDSFGGYDPYSSSKAASEILIESWRRSFVDTNNKGIATARAGNVIGGGDWAANRIIPDIFRAYYSNEKIFLRNPNSIRPWQHVLESIYGYLTLAMVLFNNPHKFSTSYNFGPIGDDVLTVKELTEIIVSKINFNRKNIVFETSNFHEAKSLLLDVSKSGKELNWYPKLDSKESINLTIEWYKNYKISNVINLTKTQINNYFND
jgi:CDP-glucose 4,6-dehydratase